MRHKASLPVQYFENLFAENPDPWQFETSPYEREKYDHTLASLPKQRFQRAIEIGCANGVLTERLAERCDVLIAVDIAEQAVARAKQRCASMVNVTVQKASVPDDKIPGMFDLILLSEVIYYWDSADIKKAADYFSSAIQSAGYILLVHWTGETNYPKSADEAVNELRAAMGDGFAVTCSQNNPHYRLDLWQRT